MNTDDGFILRSRSVEIRFRIDKARLAKSRGIMKMKCLAKIDQFPAATREKTTKVFIMPDDFLSNQKLINWQNSGEFFVFVMKVNSRRGSHMRFILFVTGNIRSSVQLLSIILPCVATLTANIFYNILS